MKPQFWGEAPVVGPLPKKFPGPLLTHPLVPEMHWDVAPPPISRPPPITEAGPVFAIGPHLRGHQFMDELGRIEFLVRETFVRQALAEAKGGHKVKSFRFADSRDFLDLFDGAAAQTGQ